MTCKHFLEAGRALNNGACVVCLQAGAAEWEARHAHVYDELCVANARAVAAEKAAIDWMHRFDAASILLRNADKRAEALKNEAEKYLANIEERQAEFTKLVDRCLLGESEAKRFHSAFAAETLARNSAEAMLREAREVVVDAERAISSPQTYEWRGAPARAAEACRVLIAKLAAREGQS